MKKLSLSREKNASIKKETTTDTYNTTKKKKEEEEEEEEEDKEAREEEEEWISFSLTFDFRQKTKKKSDKKWMMKIFKRVSSLFLPPHFLCAAAKE